MASPGDSVGKDAPITPRQLTVGPQGLPPGFPKTHRKCIRKRRCFPGPAGAAECARRHRGRFAPVADGKPFDVFSGARARTFADILESFVGKRRSFQTVGEKPAHNLIREKFHAAVGVMDDEPFPRAEQL